MSESQSPDLPPWFADRATATVLIYKVNRRPLGQPTLFANEAPTDVLDHFAEALLIGEPVETGRANLREWRLGNRRIDESVRTVTGQIGFERQGSRSSDQYVTSRKEWVSVVDVEERTAHAPFAFSADTQAIAVLKHPLFTERVIPQVFNDTCSIVVSASERRGRPPSGMSNLYSTSAAS